MKKYKDSQGNLLTVEKITTQDDIAHIRKCGFFGSSIAIGDYSLYLGPADGGYLILQEGDSRLVEV